MRIGCPAIVFVVYATFLAISPSHAADCVSDLKLEQGAVGKIIQCLKEVETENAKLKKRIVELEKQPAPLGEDKIRGIAKTVNSSEFKGVTEQTTKNLIAEALKPLAPFLVAKEGAVISFNRSEDRGARSGGGACPAGWSLFKPASGRFIVGAGQHSNPDTSAYPAFRDNPTKAIGGEETVTLIEEQLAKHSHVTAQISGDTYGYVDVPTDLSNTNLAVGHPNIKQGKFHISGSNTTETGENLAHNNLPPYVALYFCKRVERN